MIIAFLCFGWAFCVSVFAIPSIIKVAHMKNLLDEPNKRTIHESLTPRLGGLAIFAGLMSAFTIFGQFDQSLKELMAGCILLFFIGLKDDIISVSVFKKFFIQLLATGIVIFMGDIRVTSFQGFMGINDLDSGASYAFSFLMIIGLTNAINLIDGVDGLAGTIVFIIAMMLGIYFLNDAGGYAHFLFSLGGALAGFLRYNLHKAIIFMGDTGSLIAGFIVSVMGVKFIELKPAVATPSVALAIFIVPVIDTLRVFFIRVMAGRSPFSPDRNHIHHRLKRLGLRPLYIVLIMAFFNILFCFMTYQLSFLGNTILIAIIAGSAVILSIILEIIYSKKVVSLRKYS